MSRPRIERVEAALVPSAGAAIAGRPTTPAARAERLVEAWLRSKNPATVRAYQADLADFAAWSGHASVQAAIAALLSAPDGGSVNWHVDAYRSDLMKRVHGEGTKARRGFAPATINRRLAALRSIAKLGRVFGWITWTIEIGGVEVADSAAPAPAVLEDGSPDEREYGLAAVRRIRAHLEAKLEADSELERRTAHRDLALIRLLYDSALRREEAVDLDWPDHVDLRRRVLHVWGKKRDQREAFPIDVEPLEVLRAWIKVRGAARGPLFVALDRRHAGELKRLNVRGVNKIITRLAKTTGVAIKPHDFRRVSITRALEKTDGNVQEVMPFSRHRQPATLMRYDLKRRNLPRKIAELVARDEGEDDDDE